MKRLMACGLTTLLACAGCAQQYVMKLNNGARIMTEGRPALEGDSYYYKDKAGQKHRISVGSVAEVEPASMAKEEKSPFTVTPAK